MQMLYQLELGAGSSLEQIFDSFDLEDYVSETDRAAEEAEGGGAPRRGAPADRREIEDSFAYARQLAQGATLHAEAIDELIRRFAENWRLERMPIIDRNILRLAVYEMLYESSVPKVVIVDEAIELAKKFGSENSGRFVNGLLDGVLKSQDVEAAGSAPVEQSVSGTGSAGGSP